MVANPDQSLDFSVVIPVYNDPKGIELTLRSVVSQTYPQTAYEVIVVDNGSTDSTQDTIKSFVKNYEHVRLVVEDKFQGPGAARNTAICNSRGSFIAFIDSDMTVEADWLADARKTFRELDTESFGCEIELYSITGQDRLIERYEMAVALQVDELISMVKFIPTGCLFIKKSAIEDIGLFDFRLKAGEDVEFGRRLYRSGRTLHFEPTITVYHPTRDSLGALLRQHFKKGIGFYQLDKHHPGENLSPGVRLLKPPNVGYFSQRVSEWGSLDEHEKVAFYMFEYIMNLASAIGILYCYLLNVVWSIVPDL